MICERGGVAIALITNYLADYRLPLYQRLAERYPLEVLCYGGGERYVPSWFADLDAQLAAASFPARRVDGLRSAVREAGAHELVIAPFAGGAMLPAVYAGAQVRRRRFILWASVWAQPRSRGHTLAWPAIRHIYRHADAVLAYGEHVRRFVGEIRGRIDDVVVAAQAVEPELFARAVAPQELAAFRAAHGLGDGPLVAYVGRLVPEKGVDVLLRAFGLVGAEATLALAGEGELKPGTGVGPRVRALGSFPREQLPVLYAAAAVVVLPSVPFPRFREPWGLVLNEAMLGGRPVIASDGVGAAAGGLVRNGETGLVVPAGDARALAEAIDRVLSEPGLADRLRSAGRSAAGELSYAAAVEAFDRAIALAGGPAARGG